MIFTTTNTVDGYEISKYLRIIAGETVTGINMLKDFGASIRNITGGRAPAFTVGSYVSVSRPSARSSRGSDRRR